MIPVAQPGTYVIWFFAPHPGRRVRVGQLGEFACERGWYAYVGSALGPGGLAARVARHLRASKRRRWHVDYLQPAMRPRAVWFRSGHRRLECPWARALGAHPWARSPLSNFGASDCGCPTHLFAFSRRPEASRIDPKIVRRGV